MHSKGENNHNVLYNTDQQLYVQRVQRYKLGNLLRMLGVSEVEMKCGKQCNDDDHDVKTPNIQ